LYNQNDWNDPGTNVEYIVEYPEAAQVTAVLYYFTFVLLTSFILLSMVIGALTIAMTTAGTVY
jgi:hypothetical protein